MNVNIYLQDALLAHIDRLARELGQSRSALIRQAVEAWIARRPAGGSRYARRDPRTAEMSLILECDMNVRGFVLSASLVLLTIGAPGCILGNRPTLVQIGSRDDQITYYLDGAGNTCNRSRPASVSLFISPSTQRSCSKPCAAR